MPKTLPKGHASLLGSGFRYTPALHTDLAKTFSRIREQQLKETSLPTETGRRVRAR
jgi:hypothetical protein